MDACGLGNFDLLAGVLFGEGLDLLQAVVDGDAGGGADDAGQKSDEKGEIDSVVCEGPGGNKDVCDFSQLRKDKNDSSVFAHPR